MMNRMHWIIILATILAIAVAITCQAFDTKFAYLTVDWLAFLAGIFLVVEGAYKILRSKDPFFPFQLLRSTRVFIGMCIFTIHLLQLMRY